MLLDRFIYVKERAVNIFRKIYFVVTKPFVNLRYSLGEGRDYKSLESSIDEYYNRKITGSFSDRIKSIFDVNIISTGRIYLSRKSLENSL